MFEFKYDEEEQQINIIPEKTKDQYKVYVLSRIINLLLECDNVLLYAFWRVISWVFMVIRNSEAAKIDMDKNGISFRRIKK